MKQAASSAGVLLGLLFNTEDGGYMFLRNVVWLSPEYKTFYPGRQNSSCIQLLPAYLNLILHTTVWRHECLCAPFCTHAFCRYQRNVIHIGYDKTIGGSIVLEACYVLFVILLGFGYRFFRCQARHENDWCKKLETSLFWHINFFPLSQNII
jgi:hypothetical protein